MFFVTGPDGKETGPVAIEALRQWAVSGQLPPQAPVRRMGGEPVRADRLPELAGLWRGGPPPTAQTLGGLIPTGNPAALWGYYLGFGAIVPLLGVVAVPFCIWKSVQGMKAFKANPAVRGMTHSVIGLVLGALGTGMQLLALLIILAGARSYK